MSRLYACIISKDAGKNKAVLLSVAQQFSYSIEMLEDGVLFDVSGLENLIGNREQISQKILDQLEANKISAKVRIAETTETAVLLARGDDDSTAVANTPLEFEDLPLKNLPIEESTLNIFNDLGIRKVQELRQIPVDDLIGRYGQQFRGLVNVIEQNGKRLLQPNVKEESAAWSYDLDFPIDDFEQMIFIINHGLDKLLCQVRHSGFSTDQLDISFRLRNKPEKDYEVKASFPTLEKTFWLKLLNLRVSLDPPETEIVSVKILSWFTRPRPDRRGLYAVSRPEPEDLQLTINKVKKLVGDGNVGVPVLLDQRLSEPFTLDSEKFPQDREKVDLGAENLIVGFSYFKPPIPTEVTVEDKRLLFIRTPYFSGSVTEYSGVWKENSHWWGRPWDTHEWDIEVENQGVYRLRKVGKDWFLAGEYD